MSTNLKSVAGILHAPSTGLQALLEKASVLQQINHSLAKFLAAPLNQHIVLANVRDDTAVLLAESSVWLTKARYQAPSILKFLTQDVGLNKLKKIQFKVLPHSETANQKPTPLSMSAHTAQFLKSVSQNIHDSDLKTAIKKLSNNFQPKV